MMYDCNALLEVGREEAATTPLIRVGDDGIHFDFHQPLRIDEARDLYDGIHWSNVSEDFTMNPRYAYACTPANCGGTLAPRCAR
jgi:hypothetical protein